jgi:hypothetical protein
MKSYTKAFFYALIAYEKLGVHKKDVIKNGIPVKRMF